MGTGGDEGGVVREEKNFPFFPAFFACPTVPFPFSPTKRVINYLITTY